MEPEKTSADVTKEVCSDIWWVVLLRGLAVTILGLLMVSRPAETLLILIQFMGAYWLIDGIFTIVASIRGRKTAPNWGWGMFVGILSIIGGLVVFSRPIAVALLTSVFLMWFLGIVAIVSGISSIVTGFRLRKAGVEDWSMILAGAVWVILGLLLLSSPWVAVQTLVWIIGLFSLIGGIMLIVWSFRVRKMGQTGTPTT